MDINELWPGKSANGLTLINWAQNYGTLISSCVHPHISICRVESPGRELRVSNERTRMRAHLLRWILCLADSDYERFLTCKNINMQSPCMHSSKLRKEVSFWLKESTTCFVCIFVTKTVVVTGDWWRCRGCCPQLPSPGLTPWPHTDTGTGWWKFHPCL